MEATLTERRLLRDQIAFVPKQVLLEDRQDGRKRMHVEGTFSVAGKVTGNNRRYGLPIWQKHVGDRQSRLMKRVAEHKVLGLLEHPESEPNLEKVSHLFEDLKLMPEGSVWGRVLILETPSGNILKELFEVGVPVGSSSRGEGSTVLADDGVTEDVQDDYEPESWDFVHTPAIEQARSKPVKESLEKARKESAAMKQEVEKAKALIAEAESRTLSALGLAELTALHTKVIEAMTPLTAGDDAGVAEVRGRLAGLASQVSKVIAENSKSASERVSEKFNENYPDAMQAVTSLVEELVNRNNALQAELTKLREGKEENQELVETKQKLSEVEKRLAAAMDAGEELVKRTNKLVRESQKKDKKLAIAVNTLDKVMEAVRAKGLHQQVDLLVSKIPALRHVKEQLLRSDSARVLQERAKQFTKAIRESSGQKEEPKDELTLTAPPAESTEPLPPPNAKKGKRIVESEAAGNKKPATMFTRMAERGL